MERADIIGRISNGFVKMYDRLILVRHPHRSRIHFEGQHVVRVVCISGIKLGLNTEITLTWLECQQQNPSWYSTFIREPSQLRNLRAYSIEIYLNILA